MKEKKQISTKSVHHFVILPFNWNVVNFALQKELLKHQQLNLIGDLYALNFVKLVKVAFYANVIYFHFLFDF